MELDPIIDAMTGKPIVSTPEFDAELAEIHGRLLQPMIDKARAKDQSPAKMIKATDAIIAKAEWRNLDAKPKRVKRKVKK